MLSSHQSQRGVASFALCLLLSGCSTAYARQSIRVHDGDTFMLNGHWWRLWGVDAAELEQVCRRGPAIISCGVTAGVMLRALLNKGDVHCEKRGQSYNRAVGVCFAGQLDVGAAMVRRGWALNWDSYSHGAYADEQAEAQHERIGLWSLQFQRPWEWRAQHQR